MTAFPPYFPESKSRRANAVLARAGLDIASLSACVLAVLTSTSAYGHPVYTSDVAPILNAHCVGCHRPQGSASNSSLASFESAKTWAAAIRENVVDREMPPWPADADRSVKFRNDSRLTSKEIETLVAWVDAGAPRGEGAQPPSVHSSIGWAYPGGRAPDMVITLPEFTAPATGEIPYLVRRVKVSSTTDRWITALQVRPGNAALVHHMGITEISLNDGMTPSDADAIDELARKMGMENSSAAFARPAVTDPMDTENYDMLGVYTPGTTLESFDAGTAKLLKAGSNNYINFNIHYTTIGASATDQSQLALWFRRDAPQHQLFRSPAAVDTLIANGRQLLADDPGTPAEGTYAAIPPIPAGAENYQLIGMTAYTKPVTIYQVQPHAHMRGKSFTYSVVYADGHEQTLLTVPKYDFHWQLAYQLDRPLHLPAGSKLVVKAVYDNSPNNVHLRNLTGDVAKNCGPDKQAFFRRQNQTWNEMFSPLVQYSVDLPPGAGTGGRPELKLVGTVGCLTQDSSSPSEWALVRASAAAPSSTQSTSAAANAADALTPLSDRQYSLVGTSFFEPQRYVKRKVSVKGVLITGKGTTRLNVTSLQPVAGSCS